MPKKSNPATKSKAFITPQTIGGLLLIAMVIFALIVANSSFAETYEKILSFPLFLSHSHHILTVSDWINDGLMALFFLGIGMEVKREVSVGELSSGSLGILPVTMAIGGMVVPALIFFAFNNHIPERTGWAIPTATDIAFTLGILSLLGTRIPNSLRVAVASLAIIDDLGAVLIIALFYSSNLSGLYLALVAAIVLLQYTIRTFVDSPNKWILILGIPLWYCMLQSGVHATIAGILTGAILPYSKQTFALETKLNKWVGYTIVPVFAFINAGIHLNFDLLPSLVSSGIFIGTALGLVVGKPLGIMLATRITIKYSRSTLPQIITTKMVLGAAMLCGMGFTMSLFVTNLAFASDGAFVEAAKLAILTGSLVSGIAGYCYLRKYTTLPN